jgi:hypothetical protein
MHREASSIKKVSPVKPLKDEISERKQTKAPFAHEQPRPGGGSANGVRVSLEKFLDQDRVFPCAREGAAQIRARSNFLRFRTHTDQRESTARLLLRNVNLLFLVDAAHEKDERAGERHHGGPDSEPEVVMTALRVMKGGELVILPDGEDGCGQAHNPTQYI